MFDLGSNVTVEEEVDSLGGKGPLDSGIYDFKIKLAYITKSGGGAMAVNLVLETDKKQELKETIYISSGDAKGNKFTYKDKQGNEQPLPGYSQINTLCRLAIGKELRELEPETKTISLYDYTAKKEVPTQVPVLTDLLNEEIALGVLKIIEDKRSKNAEGKYVANGETRIINSISKIFKAEGHLTGAEIAAGLTEGEFAPKWASKNNGIVVDKSTKVSTPASSAPVASPTGKSTPTKSLFGQ